jgi:hypothetical protein
MGRRSHLGQPHHGSQPDVPNCENLKESGSADSHYYDWVDQFDTLGLGKNTPIITGNSSDSLIALVNGEFAVLRVPYPLGFFAKGMDGRIDDPRAGWKGKRGLDLLGDAHAVPLRNGEGDHAQGRAFPNQAQSPGGLGSQIRSMRNT